MCSQASWLEHRRSIGRSPPTLGEYERPAEVKVKPEFALSVLRRHRAEAGALAARLGLEAREDGVVCSRSPVGAEPEMPDLVTKFTGRVAKANGVDTHLHVLRHFSATPALAAGFEPVTVGARLGYADPSITLRCDSHALEQRDRAVGVSARHGDASAQASIIGARDLTAAHGAATKLLQMVGHEERAGGRVRATRLGSALEV